MKHKKKLFLLLTLWWAWLTIKFLNYTIYKIFKFKNYNNNFLETVYGKVSYRVYGSGKPILLVHDIKIGSSKDDYKNIVNKLKRNYTVYCIDLIGFGQSEKDNIHYNSYMYVSIINKFVKEIIKEKCNVLAFGLSCNYIIFANKFEKDYYNKIFLYNPKCENTKNNNKYLNKFCNILLKSDIGDLIYNFYSIYKVFILKNGNLYNLYLGGNKNKYLLSELVCNRLFINIASELKNLDNKFYIYSKNKKYFNTNVNLITNKIVNEIIENI